MDTAPGFAITRLPCAALATDAPAGGQNQLEDSAPGGARAGIAGDAAARGGAPSDPRALSVTKPAASRQTSTPTPTACRRPPSRRRPGAGGPPSASGARAPAGAVGLGGRGGLGGRRWLGGHGGRVDLRGRGALGGRGGRHLPGRALVVGEIVVAPEGAEIHRCRAAGVIPAGPPSPEHHEPTPASTTSRFAGGSPSASSSGSRRRPRSTATNASSHTRASPTTAILHPMGVA